MKALVTDIDGTITNHVRRISLPAIEAIRRLVDGGVPVVLASGNTLCFMDGIAKMVGTDGTVICENGGVWRRGFFGEPVVEGDRRIALTAFEALRDHYAGKGLALDPFSHGLRYADVAFARTVPRPGQRRAALHEVLRHVPRYRALLALRQVLWQIHPGRAGERPGADRHPEVH
jgi:hypothetical protein